MNVIFWDNKYVRNETWIYIAEVLGAANVFCLFPKDKDLVSAFDNSGISLYFQNKTDIRKFCNKIANDIAGYMWWESMPGDWEDRDRDTNWYDPIGNIVEDSPCILILGSINPITTAGIYEYSNLECEYIEYFNRRGKSWTYLSVENYIMLRTARNIRTKIPWSKFHEKICYLKIDPIAESEVILHKQYNPQHYQKQFFEQWLAEILNARYPDVFPNSDCNSLYEEELVRDREEWKAECERDRRQAELDEIRNREWDEEQGIRYSHYEGSYASDIGGYDDDTIDSAFDGDPDAYWNID